jgi:photosystem II stability/assembly factor-like uncharacterized protein
MKKVILLTFFLISAKLIFSQTATFSEQTSGVTVQLTSAYAINSLTAWICGYSGTVLRTTNSGTNWLNSTGTGIPATRMLINIFALDANNAITAGYEGTTTYVYRTTNAGINWVQVFTEANGFINAVWMISNTNGFMEGDPTGTRWSLWKTTNGGASWDSTGLYLPKTGADAGWNNSMIILPGGNNSQIWFGTNNSRVYYSSNYGTSWSAQSTGSELNTYSVYFPTQGSINDGLAGGTNLLRTTNNGLNWNILTSSGTGNINGITGNSIFLDNALMLGYTWYVRSSTNIFYSGTNGSTWNSVYTAPAGTYRHISPTSGASTGVFWAVRNNGGITKGTYQIGSINPINKIPKNYLLPRITEPSIGHKIQV